MVKILGHLDQKDEIFAKDYTPPPVKKKRDSQKIIMVPTGALKNLPIKSISKKNKRVRLKTTKDATQKIKEIRNKEKRDAFKLEMAIEKDKRVQQSPSRSLNTTASRMNNSTSNMMQQTQK